jgi:hypothetical protein
MDLGMSVKADLLFACSHSGWCESKYFGMAEMVNLSTLSHYLGVIKRLGRSISRLSVSHQNHSVDIEPSIKPTLRPMAICTSKITHTTNHHLRPPFHIG